MSWLSSCRALAKNDTERLTCITIKDSQQKDLKYDLYWDSKRVDKHIKKFIDNIYEAVLEAAWSFNHANRTIFQDTIHIIEEKVTWTLFKKNTGFNCTISSINNNFIKHLKLTNNLLPTLEIMKERRYNLYGDVKCRMCLKENEDNNHLIYCQQLRDKWLMVINNTRYKCSNQELPIPFIHLMLRNFFPKERYRKFKIIWQPHCNLITEWKHIKGIKKQDLKKKIPANQHIAYERIPTQQVEGNTYDLKGRRILKHNEQWSIALEKTRQYVNQFIKEGNRVIWKDIGEFHIGDGRAQEQSIGWGTGSDSNHFIMPKTRGNFWFEYEVTVDSNGKEKYTCKTCSGTWSKNASCLKEHIEKCKNINIETETSQP
ncbi:hypothetical protein C1646_770118 [Rhizophagus diaphanus]|nr:hypothetical protein C1646_770118 [Rhizophagus diaphanus] [Rhizophagus sp. MUCL 43196]